MPARARSPLRFEVVWAQQLTMTLEAVAAAADAVCDATSHETSGQLRVPVSAVEPEQGGGACAHAVWRR